MCPLEPERRLVMVDDDTAHDAVIGYRAWRAEAKQGVVTLTSVVALRNHEWPKSQPFTATCIDIIGRHGDRAPVTGCDCGIFAFADLRRCRLSFLEQYFVFGEVALFGTVKIHRHGYRASCAKPLALYPPRASSSKERVAAQRMIVELACQQYDIPLVQAPPLAVEVPGG